MSNGKYGFVNKKGKEVIPLEHRFIYKFEKGVVVGYKDDKYGFINKNGEFIIPMKFRW